MLGSRRMLAAVSFGVVVFVAGCGGPDFRRGSSPTVPATTTTAAPRVTLPAVVVHNPALRAVVVSAVPRTAAARTARTSISVTLTGLGEDALSNGAYDIAGNGAVDLTTGDADLKLSIPLFDRLGGGGTVVEQRTVGGVVYTKLPTDILAIAGLPPAVRWLRIDPNTVAAADPSVLSQSQVDPAGQLAFLAAMSDDVRVVGHEQVRGFATTHYTSTIDLAHAGRGAHRTADLRRTLLQLGSGQALPQLTIDVWVDRTGLARRIVVSVPLDPAKSGSMLRIQADFYAFGAPLTVSAPPAAQVKPYSALALTTPTG
jgi:hypothetical protein